MALLFCFFRVENLSRMFFRRGMAFVMVAAAATVMVSVMR
jgi:hypothetical protein